MVAIIGGVKGIERDYKEVLKASNLKCKIYNQKCNNFDKKIQNCEACIIFTNTVSHKMALACKKICKKNNIQLINLHSSGVNQLREAIGKVEI